MRVPNEASWRHNMNSHLQSRLYRYRWDNALLGQCGISHYSGSLRATPAWRNCLYQQLSLQEAPPVCFCFLFYCSNLVYDRKKEGEVHTLLEFVSSFHLHIREKSRLHPPRQVHRREHHPHSRHHCWPGYYHQNRKFRIALPHVLYIG